MKSKASILVVFLMMTSFLFGAKNQDTESLYWLAKKMQYQQQDSALIWYDQCAREFLAKGDTAKSINALIDASLVYSTNANYSKSYDGFWQALILATQTEDSVRIGRIYDGLGILYGLFFRYDESENYYHKSVALKKELIKNGSLENDALVSTYYGMAIVNRDKGNYEVAQLCLDTCMMIKEQQEGGPQKVHYIEAEQAFLDYLSGKFEQAEQSLITLLDSFEGNIETFRVIIYSFLGDINVAQNQQKSGEDYYLKSLEVANRLNCHQNFVPQVYKKLSKLYLDVNKGKLAYEYLDRSAHLTDSIFGARSENNSQLLEIKDAYLLKQEEQKKLNEEIRISKLEREKQRGTIRNLMLIVVLIIVFVTSFVTYFYLKYIHRIQQNMLRLEQKGKDEKNREVLEVKNKELTSSALQLIEKDELLLEVKNKLAALKLKEDSRGIQEVMNKIKANSSNDWDAFNARFTSVNESFYEKLKEKFPELTQRDHKLCALIKLNFSSKEMSQLLGISVESVHTSRYRLRQKLNLGKGDNLTEFIAGV